jgi:tetratricopeptide (TPR) repeat protein
VDTQTRHALKQDNFVQATTTGLDWLEANRSRVLKVTVPVLIVLLMAIAGIAFWNQKSGQADVALGKALSIYSSPLAQPGQPALPGTYATSADRAREANKQFLVVAQQYGWLEAGKQARYFAGLSYIDLGQTGPAEEQLQQVANSGSGHIAPLAKMALAGLYHRTGRDSQAIDLYKQLIAKPSDTVPATQAQLALAALYQSQNNLAAAKEIYAKLKDTDKDTAAGKIAEQKLTELK